MKRTQVLIALLALALALHALPAFAKKRDRNICRKTTRTLHQACRFGAADDRRVARAICLNTADARGREECFDDAADGYREAREECRDQAVARNELCRIEGFGGAYDPEVDPANFVAGIDNPNAPFAVGSTWIYEKDTEDGVERVEVEVLPGTREIVGVVCTIVRDRVFLDGELIEDTEDWLAQDVDGNVWYFGELAIDFEDGEISGIGGSWETGKDGARPGFWMPASHEVGDVYRQEWLPAEAEDVAEVADTDAQESVPFAGGSPVLKTRDFTPLEPGVEEFKFYVPGVGLVLEVDPESGERLELLEYSP